MPSFGWVLVTKIDPIAMLFWAAVINGVVAVPIMFATMVVVSSKREARRVALPRWLMVLGWLAAHSRGRGAAQ